MNLFKNLLSICFLLIQLSSCNEIIEVEDISNKKVNVLAPTSGLSLNITNVNFSWSSLEDAENYKLQISTPNFEMTNQIVLDTTIALTNFSKILEQGNYEWRVRAENSDFQTDYTTQSFTIE